MRLIHVPRWRLRNWVIVTVCTPVVILAFVPLLVYKAFWWIRTRGSLIAVIRPRDELIT